MSCLCSTKENGTWHRRIGLEVFTCHFWVAEYKVLVHDISSVMELLTLCFVSYRSCRKAPLVACDYCPLLFHQDCLDPPLTSLPTGRWMCPNHAEQYLVSTVICLLMNLLISSVPSGMWMCPDHQEQYLVSAVICFLMKLLICII
jgi:hypothetical protein